MMEKISKTFSGDEPKSSHAVFLETQVIANLIKIQKEIGWRRFRECQAPIQEAILALKAFEKETWPPTTTTTEEETSAIISNTIHPAIKTTIEAYKSVLTHPDATKVYKPSELALVGITLLVNKWYIVGRADGAEKKDNDNNNETESSTEPSVLQQVLEVVAKTSESQDIGMQTALIDTMTAIATSPKCEIHENALLLAVRSTFHVYLVSKKQSCKDVAKRAVLDMLKAVFVRMEAHDAMLNNNNDSVQSQRDANTVPTGGLPTQYHLDAYSLFRSFCKLSSKELPADETDEQLSLSGHSSKAKEFALFFNTNIPTDPTELQSKILSLELILHVFTEFGDSLVGHDKFLTLVQHYVSGSLLKNCVSNHTQVAFLSQNIFLVLVYKFKGHLKKDIEVFMSNVFFRVLESKNSSFKQKALVLESLRSLCKDPVLLTQIFLNYDCDFDAMNLYKDIVHMLTKLGGRATALSFSSGTITKRDAEQEFELSLASLECLVTILKAFLRALGLLSTSGDEQQIATEGSRIRSMLQLDSAFADSLGAAASSSLADNASAISDDLESATGGSMVVVSSSDNTVTATSSAESVVLTEKIVDAFDRKRNAEQNFEIGAVKFTLSLKTGLQFFIENGFVERDAKQIALFFLNNKDKLDKTQMGEALGREPDAALVKEPGLEADKGGPGFWVRILHYYADALHFTNIPFDDAIRLFLSGFRLPGEAQKIDRIMEKFAERYTSQNPDIFPSSDTAFILAFSVIMLNTDLHNPSIKPERRMTVESFLNNNRGIGENGSDLPEDFLRGIFQRIKERPFSLKEDDAARERAMAAPKQIFDTSLFFEGTSSLFGTSAEERKRENFKKERDEMMAVTEQLIRRRRPAKQNSSSSNDKDSSTSLTESIPPSDVVKPMFDVTWGPMLGILSQVLECSDDERSVSVCLNGFVYAVRLAAHSHMSLARDTFVSSLAKFTFLGSIKEMKRKNVECIRTLLSIAIADGEHLGESWGPVLQCMSQLAKLRLAASGLDTDESFLMIETPRVVQRTESKQTGMFRQQSPGDIAREAEENNGKAVLEAVQEVLMDKVFSSTVALSAKSLASFIGQLIAVASAEIGGISTGNDHSAVLPDGSKTGSSLSIFSLQRLVDVADYNMDVRPRLVWAQVWELMADFFVSVACHDNRMVSVFAIDSLKQLSLKFLEKPELSEFNFQCSFLRPFQVVMEDKNSREEIRELVLQCIDNIIRTKSHHLRSGWKVMFSILLLSAGDPSEKIEYLGLAILQRLLDDHLDDIGSLASKIADESVPKELSSLEKRARNVNADDFVGLCRASLSFLQYKETDSLRPFGLTMRALCHTAIYADLLASQRVLPPVSGAQFSDPNAHGYTYEGLTEHESLAMALWRPLFEGLANGIRSTAKTSETGFGCLVQRGSILALRSILLRHGHLFSTDQLCAILEKTILPAIQFAAENDHSHVVIITSESPTVSSIDFLVEPLPLPPEPDDPAMQQFAALNSSPKRPVGPAELMLEASFTLLRHGAEGDLRNAATLAKERTPDVVKIFEQPFPDSWVATVAPLALGLLTDITTEFIVFRESEGREKAWPVVAQQYKSWCVGQTNWYPCEALVRIACRELYRLPHRLYNDEEFKQLPREEREAWTSTLIKIFSETLGRSVSIEESTKREILDSKEKAYLDKHGSDNNDDFDELDKDDVEVATPFGTGRLIDTTSESGTLIEVILLNFGATLYRPATPKIATVTAIPSEVSVPEAQWVQLVPILKVRCVAAYCLQQSLLDILRDLIPNAAKVDLSKLITVLNESRLVAANAVGDDDIATAFQEVLLKDWGDGIQMAEEVMETKTRLSLLHGSATFFLSQEAGATKAVFNLLSLLYFGDDPDITSFAEPHLVKIMEEILEKFLASEARDGHLIDANSWRNASEGVGKLPLYCTMFASVVVDILRTICSMQANQFDKHKQTLFPAICSLVCVHCDEIRKMVQEILIIQVAPKLGVEIDVSKMSLRNASTDQ